MQIEAARDQAEEARRHVEVEAEIGRLVDVRSTLRAWQFVLDGALAELQLAGTLDLDRFREEEREAMLRGVRALDEVMHDQWYVQMSHYDAFAPRRQDPPSPNRLLVEALKEYGARIRAVALAGHPVSVEDREELHELKAQASRERGTMSEIIEHRLEGIVNELPRNPVPRRSRQTYPQS